MNNEIQCPKCRSNQLSVNKKGYSLTKGLTGMILTGGMGLLGGLFGSNKVIITCLSCGKEFKPSDGEFSNNEMVKPDPTQRINYANVPNNVIEDDPFFQNEFLKDLKKEALFCDNEGDLETAQLMWGLYFEKLSELGLEPSDKDLENVFEITDKRGGLTTMFFYEDLIKWFPMSYKVSEWEQKKSDLDQEFCNKMNIKR